MLRVLLNLLTSFCIACFLATLILWALVLTGQSYAFGGTAGSNWGARADRLGFFFHWNTSGATTGTISWKRVESENIADLPGLHVEKLDLITEPAGVAGRTVVRSITALHLRYWLLIVVFGLVPAARLAWLRGKIRSRRRVLRAS